MASTGTRRSLSGDYATAVALGDITGVASFRKFGMNGTVNNGTWDVWPSASTRVLPTVAATASIVSTSAADAAAGTGGRTMYLEGLDTNYAVISETITLNGTTPVISANSYLRINESWMVTAGSGEVNTGQITTSVGGNVQSIIEAGEGQAHCAQYTIPANKELLILSTRFGSGRMTTSTDMHVLGQIKLFGANTSWRSIQDVYLFQYVYEPGGVGGLLVPEKTDIRYRVNANSNTNQVWAEYTGWMVDL